MRPLEFGDSRSCMEWPHNAEALYPSLLGHGNAVRLLTVHAAASLATPVKCSLSTVDLDTLPRYEALSYTWGDDPLTKTITINQQPLDIRDNLYQALIRIRCEDRDRTIWVDAISIHQDSLKEKSEQVQKIDQIFRNADAVLVWLGHHDEQSRTIFRFMQDFDAQVLSDRELGLAAEAMISLANRPYWNRTWVVQEFVLAHDKVFYCGEDMITDQHLRDFYDRFSQQLHERWKDEFRSMQTGKFKADSKTRSPSDLPFKRLSTQLARARYSALKKQAMYGRANDPDLHFYGILNRHRTTVCLDSRDKVYALQSLLAPERRAERIVVDYETPVEDLFFRIMNTWADTCTIWIAKVLMDALGVDWPQLQRRADELTKPIDANLMTLQAYRGKVTSVHLGPISGLNRRFFQATFPNSDDEKNGTKSVKMLTYVSEGHSAIDDKVIQFPTGTGAILIHDNGVETPEAYGALLLSSRDGPDASEIRSRGLDATHQVLQERFQGVRIEENEFDYKCICSRLSPSQIIAICSCDTRSMDPYDGEL